MQLIILFLNLISNYQIHENQRIKKYYFCYAHINFLTSFDGDVKKTSPKTTLRMGKIINLLGVRVYLGYLDALSCLNCV